VARKTSTAENLNPYPKDRRPDVSERVFGRAEVYRVKAVISGHEFVCDLNGYPPVVGEDIRVRVTGIAAPKLADPNHPDRDMAVKARQLASRLLFDSQEIELANIRRGKHFMLEAEVIVDGDSLADILLENGCARPANGNGRR